MRWRPARGGRWTSPERDGATVPDAAHTSVARCVGPIWAPEGRTLELSPPGTRGAGRREWLFDPVDDPARRATLEAHREQSERARDGVRQLTRVRTFSTRR